MARSSNLVDEIQEQIRVLVLGGQYQEGDYLPSEGELAKRFDVSHATIRESIRSLEVRGFVERQHGKGIMVTKHNGMVMTQSLKDMVEMNQISIYEILEVRSALELEAAELAAERADDGDIRRMQEDIDGMLRSEEDMKAYADYDFDFHVNLARASKNKMLINIVNAYMPSIRSSIEPPPSDEAESRSGYHQKVLDSIVKRDQEGAVRNMRAHLSATRANFYSS